MGWRRSSPSRGPNDLAAAVDASGIKDATRVRLLRRSDGPVYVVTGRIGHPARFALTI